MFQVSREILDEMVKIIVDTVHPEKIILFGSWARGTEKTYSDIDFLIVESVGRERRTSRRKQTVEIWQRLARFRMPTDILIFSQQEMDYWRDSINHVISHALREGSLVYERH